VVATPFTIALGRKLGVAVGDVTLFYEELDSDRRHTSQYYLAFMTLGWGLCTIGSAYCKNQSAFYFIRILQSLFESPLVQLSLYYISTLYPRANYGVRLAFYTGFSIFGGGFGSETNICLSFSKRAAH
jgi:MFS family permease